MYDLHQNRVGILYGESITLAIASTTVVALRFVARRKAGTALWWDDWVILLALILNYGVSATIWIAGGAYGVGRHTELYSASDLESFWKDFFALEIVYFCCSAATKTSLILLYYRIFGIVRRFRIALIVAGVVVTSYFTANLFASIFECIPLALFWNTAIKGKCVNKPAFWRWNGFGNLLTDIMLLCLTLPMVWNLKITFKQKMGLTGVFLLGTFVCVASLIRITIFSQYNPKDTLYTIIMPMVWSSVEQSLGIVCACLPVLKPLFGRFLPSHSAAAKSDPDSDKINLSNMKPKSPWRTFEDTNVTGFSRLDEADIEGQTPTCLGPRVETQPPFESSVTTEVTSGSPKDPVVFGSAILKNQSVEQRFDDRT